MDASSEIKTLQELLERTASSYPTAGILFYDPTPGTVVKETYASILEAARAKIPTLHHIPGIKPESIVLLHFDDHRQNIEWFWAAVLAGYLPAISPPFTNNVTQHKVHLAHLQRLLINPVILTDRTTIHCFDHGPRLDVHAVEDLTTPAELQANGALMSPRIASDMAVLMLTSGSTGNAKAVALTNDQLIASAKSKSLRLGTTSEDVFLNWIGFDHVASLTESHLHAMKLGADQIHVRAGEFTGDPVVFLDTIDRFRVSTTFAPNFFLASLEKALGALDPSLQRHKWDLSSLQTVTSGGEGNSVGTAVKLMALLKEFGVRQDVIVPGFGMTETCAGSIWNKSFPASDIAKEYEFASLGKCNAGISMRIRLPGGDLAPVGTIGNLELSGRLVFKEYFNNPIVNKESFSGDGWFITGDLAYIDTDGNLCLAGRTKDTININGVKHAAEDVEAALEDANIAGVQPSFIKAFGYRPEGAATEAIVVLYVAAYEKDDDKMRHGVSSSIKRTVLGQCGSSPYKTFPVPKDAMRKTSLGKISRAKLTAAFVAGEFESFDEENEKAIKDYAALSFGVPTTDIEKIVCEVVAKTMGLPIEEVGTSTAFIDMGVSSVEVIRVKQELQRRLGIKEISAVTFLVNVTIGDLAKALEELKNDQGKPYSPLVILNERGSNTPLWMVHPGAGEILVYLNLAKFFPDRPVYALRARGFDGEPYFDSIPELINTYVETIKKVQPHGPYAIMGYSFGSMFAFNISKSLIASGEEVKFLGILNLPPHVKQRIRELNLNTAVLTLALFLGLIKDDDPDRFHPDFWKISHREVFDHVLKQAPPGRLEEMGLNYESFITWAEVSNSLHVMAWDYDPSGSVPFADVFIAHPLKAVARNKKDWFENQVIHWRDFVGSVRFHDAEGEHFNMIDENHVQSFQKKLKAAMKARGV